MLLNQVLSYLLSIHMALFDAHYLHLPLNVGKLKTELHGGFSGHDPDHAGSSSVEQLQLRFTTLPTTRP